MTEEFDKRLGQRLTRDREAAGLTMAGLAAATEINKSTVSRIEAGTLKPSPETLVRIAKTLGTEPEDYFVMAGYATAEGLPGLGPYLRTKYGASDDLAREMETYFNYLRSRDENREEMN